MLLIIVHLIPDSDDPYGLVQPQQWRPDPVVISPDQVTAWCAVAREG
jgi:hypothetical protein